MLKVTPRTGIQKVSFFAFCLSFIIKYLQFQMLVTHDGLKRALLMIRIILKIIHDDKDLESTIFLLDEKILIGN